MKKKLIEGWLTRSRRTGIRLPIFRSQWIRRYFVLSQSGSSAILEEYHCEKKEAVRKSYDLSNCEQVDSYLQLAETACGYPRFSIMSQWIFSLHLKIESRKREVLFVAQSEREMNAWVDEICRITGLTRAVEQPEAPTIRFPPGGGEEILSSFDHTPSDVTSDGPNRDQEKFTPRGGRYQSSSRGQKSNGSHQRMAPAEKKISLRARNASGETIPRTSSSASACSSMNSSHRNPEEDASSVHSSHSMGTGPPLPPRPVRNRITHQSSTTSSFGSRRGLDLSQGIPAPSCTLVEVDNESSGETIKLHTFSTHATPPPHGYIVPHGYLVLPSVSGSKTSSLCSSMAVGPSQGPPVDRSKKPAKLRLEHDDHGEDASRRNNMLTRAPRTPQYTGPSNRPRIEPPRSAGPFRKPVHLDYFEPKMFDRFEKTTTVRSSTPSDFDYIKIDAAKTKAIKIAASLK